MARIAKRIGGLFFIGVLFLGLAAPHGLGAVANDEGKVLDRLQGRWECAEIQPARGPTFNRNTGVAWKIEGQVLLTLINGKEVGRSEIVIRKESDPLEIDLIKTQEDGSRTVERGLLRLEADRFELCINRPDGDRPTEFQTDEPRPFPTIYVFQRQAR